MLIVTPRTSIWDALIGRFAFWHLENDIKILAKVPIALGWMDYTDKKREVAKIFYLSGDTDNDMKDLMEFYKDFRGNHPERSNNNPKIQYVSYCFADS